ncbi:MAG: hypothetical protein C5B52_02900 [Bacteroidetes bacterium]|nr:MAG: hypothetical protein C5B52_02900 [Bacteroidota bacterium]
MEAICNLVQEFNGLVSTKGSAQVDPLTFYIIQHFCSFFSSLHLIFFFKIFSSSHFLIDGIFSKKNSD